MLFPPSSPDRLTSLLIFQIFYTSLTTKPLVPDTNLPLVSCQIANHPDSLSKLLPKMSKQRSHPRRSSSVHDKQNVNLTSALQRLSVRFGRQPHRRLLTFINLCRLTGTDQTVSDSGLLSDRGLSAGGEWVLLTAGSHNRMIGHSPVILLWLSLGENKYLSTASSQVNFLF